MWGLGKLQQGYSQTPLFTKVPRGGDLKHHSGSQKGSVLREGVRLTAESVIDVTLLLHFKGCGS